MSPSQPKFDLYLSWVALVLVAGEFAIAVREIFNHGHGLALYMALNALIRETRGGMHYHEIVVHLFRALYCEGARCAPLISTHRT